MVSWFALKILRKLYESSPLRTREEESTSLFFATTCSVLGQMLVAVVLLLVFRSFFPSRIEMTSLLLVQQRVATVAS